MKFNYSTFRNLTITFALVSLIATALVLPFVLNFERKRQEVIVTRDYAHILAAESTVKYEIKERVNDLEFLLSTPALLDYKNSDNFTNIFRIEELFKAFCHAYGIYDQIRLISADGKELVRINLTEGRCEVVPESKLQNKVHRYYVTEAMQLSEGGIYVSPMDLNVEHGNIELPHKATLRLAAPIVSSQGKTKAILVLNFNANEFLNNLFPANPKGSINKVQGDGILTNSHGGYLRSTFHPYKEFAFQSDPGSPGIDADYPDVWQAALADKSQLMTRQGIFLISKLSGMFPGLANSDRPWYLFHFIPNASLFETSILYGPSRLGWILIYTVLLFLISALLNSRITKNKELRRRSESLAIANRNLAEKMAIAQSLSDELEIAKEKAEKLAITDHLTDLPNRLMLDESLETEINRSKRFSDPLSVIILDIDHFKQVNDIHGHLVGDEVLKKLANILKSETRQADTPGRWGGEEFLVICRETDLAGAKKLAENLRLAIESAFFPKAGRKTASFGVAEYTEKDDADTLVNRADKALYQAKIAGRNRVETG